jgi:hypothetical protein
MTSETKTETTVDNLLPDLSPLPRPENLPTAAISAPATNSTSLTSPLTLYLSPRNLEVATLVPAVLGKDGVLWVEVLGRRCELIAVGDTLALKHYTKAGSDHDGTIGFGLDSVELASFGYRVYCSSGAISTEGPDY